MHIVGIRRTLAEQHPWLPVAAMKAFEQAKARALAKLGDTAASKVTLPFLDEQLHAARQLMGDDDRLRVPPTVRNAARDREEPIR
jgi:4,5-dihydroxyphthalate decarboxylase